MARLKTFVNGGSLLPSDLDGIEDDYECAFSTYKEVITNRITLSGSPAAGTYPFYEAAPTQTGASSLVIAVRYLDPARYWSIAGTSTVNTRAVEYDLAVSMVSGNTAAGTVTFTTGLYQVTGVAAGAPTLNATAITGSTAAIANPAANTLIAAVHSGDFTAPAAGHYAIAVVTSAAMAASSVVTISARLTMRQV